MAQANDLRKGMCIRYNGNVAIVLEVMHRTPGNLRAFVQAIIRYIGTGKSADVRFASTEKVDTVDVQRKELEVAASELFDALGCAGVARVDFFATDDGLVINEINTMPGFTPYSMFPVLWEASGVSYAELVDRLVQLALQRDTGLR